MNGNQIHYWKQNMFNLITMIPKAYLITKLGYSRLGVILAWGNQLNWSIKKCSYSSWIEISCVMADGDSADLPCSIVPDELSSLCNLQPTRQTSRRIYMENIGPNSAGPWGSRLAARSCWQLWFAKLFQDHWPKVIGQPLAHPTTPTSVFHMDASFMMIWRRSWPQSIETSQHALDASHWTFPSAGTSWEFVLCPSPCTGLNHWQTARSGNEDLGTWGVQARHPLAAGLDESWKNLED